MSKILDCRPLRAKLEEQLKQEITEIGTTEGVTLTAAIIQVGKRPDSTAFISAKKKLGDKLGVKILHLEFPETISQNELLESVRAVSGDKNVHGIIVQLPLPPYIDRDTIINAIPSHKDIDGLTAINIAKSWEGHEDAITPATARGIITLLKEFQIPIEGKKVVMVGRSNLVGKPTAVACLRENATVTITHSKTPDLPAITKNAEIIVVAIGKPHFITKKFVHTDQIIVDVGITFVDGKMTGDVHPEVLEYLGKNGGVTPVPFGVGQMTVAALFSNLIQGYKQGKKDRV